MVALAPVAGVKPLPAWLSQCYVTESDQPPDDATAPESNGTPKVTFRCDAKPAVVVAL